MIWKIKNYKKMLDDLGYEYKMIYVSASLNNAQARNEKRARKLPPEIVKQDWDAAQKNAQEFKKMFGKEFLEITNDDDLKSLESKTTKISGQLITWSSKFPNNKLALAWKQAELDAKKTGEKSKNKTNVDTPNTGVNFKTFKSRRTGKTTVIRKI